MTYGQIAYEASSRYRPWEVLSQDERDRWHRVAAAILKRVSEIGLPVNGDTSKACWEGSNPICLV